MISLYSLPDRDLLRSSSNTLWSCTYRGNTSLAVVDVKEISAVVAMVPHSVNTLGNAWKDHFFVVEKPGLDVAEMSGIYDSMREDNGNQ